MKILSFSVLVRPRSTKRNNGESIGFRSFSLHFPPFFLHFLLIFFSFSSQSRHPHIRIPRTGIARALLSVNCFVGTGNPFRSVQSLEPAIFFISLPFSLLSDSFHRGKSRSARSNDRTLARERIHDLDRSSGGKTRRTRVSAPFLLLLLFFPLPRCVSRLRSSFFFLFLFSECSRFVCVIRGGSSFAPGPLDPRSTEKEIDKLA